MCSFFLLSFFSIVTVYEIVGVIMLAYDVYLIIGKVYFSLPAAVSSCCM